MKGSTSMRLFDRFNITVGAACAGLCSGAIALSPQVAAAPLITGGEDYACLESTAGELAGGAPAAAPCAPAAPVASMAGVPMALPGPVAPPVPIAPPPVPIAPPLPIAPPVPIAPPLPIAGPVPIAPVVPAGAPLTQMGGAGGGKGEVTGPPPPGAPVSGEPIWPGPTS
jgi:hypothetical protein